MSRRFRGLERYISGTGGTNGAFALAGGNFATIPEFGSEAGFYPLGDARGLRLFFCGTGADNSTFDYKIWLISTTTEFLAIPTDFIRELYGSGTATLGTALGLATAFSTDRIADTLTWTASAACTALEAAFGLGSSDKYSPASNGIASLFIPNLPGSGIQIEFDLTGATAANAVIQRVE